jgi:hypothetical protein
VGSIIAPHTDYLAQRQIDRLTVNNMVVLSHYLSFSLLPFDRTTTAH